MVKALKTLAPTVLQTDTYKLAVYLAVEYLIIMKKKQKIQIKKENCTFWQFWCSLMNLECLVICKLTY